MYGRNKTRGVSAESLIVKTVGSIQERFAEGMSETHLHVGKA
jgi:hypothetical protein